MYKRQDLGREKFLDRVWDWKQKYGDTIVNQIKRMGSSCDWNKMCIRDSFQGGTAQNQSVQLGSGRMIPGFEDGILGHKAGDEFDIHVTFPERYHAKDLAGKAVVFKIKLHDVLSLIHI